MPQHHYTQISLEEQIIIQNRLENGESIRCIAKKHWQKSLFSIARDNA